MGDSAAVRKIGFALGRLFGSRSRGEIGAVSNCLPDAAELADRYGTAVFAYAFRRVGNRETAEDIASETFAAAFQHREGGRLNRLRSPTITLPPNVNSSADHDPARAWLFGIARRKVADYLRGRERRQEVAWDSVSESGSEPGEGPEAIALRRETAERIRAVLDALPPDYREALLLKYAEGCSVAEVAAILGRSPAATDSLLQRARAAARAQGASYFYAGDEGENESRKAVERRTKP